MQPPDLSVEEFASRVRGDRGFGSASQRARAIRDSEKISAAAYDYCHVLGFMSADHHDHERACANYVAAQLRQDGITVPEKAFGVPAFLIPLLWGLGVKLLVEMIWKAAVMIAEHLRGETGAAG